MYEIYIMVYIYVGNVLQYYVVIVIEVYFVFLYFGVYNKYSVVQYY